MSSPPDSATWPSESETTPGSALTVGPMDADRRLVLLHGWGADADDLLDLGLELLPLTGLSPAEQAAISLVALRAPLPHPGGTGRQWYDLQQPEWPQLPGARLQLRERLLKLDQTVPLRHTALLGFSQGAAMALDVATGGGSEATTTSKAEGSDWPGVGNIGPAPAGAEVSGAIRGQRLQAPASLPLAAVIACSGYPHPDWQPRACRQELDDGPTTHYLLTHGEQDPVVPFAASVELERLLKQAGHSVQRLSFSGGHGIDPALLGAMGDFLAAGWRQAEHR